MAQLNRSVLNADIIANIYTNIVNFITGNNLQQRLIDLSDSSVNALSDAGQPGGYVDLDANSQMDQSLVFETISYASFLALIGASSLKVGKLYHVTGIAGGVRDLMIRANSVTTVYPEAIDINSGECGKYDQTGDAFERFDVVVGFYAQISALATANSLTPYTDYIILNAVSGTLSLIIKADSNSSTFPAATELYTAEPGVYNLGLDTWTPTQFFTRDTYAAINNLATLNLLIPGRRYIITDGNGGSEVIQFIAKNSGGPYKLSSNFSTDEMGNYDLPTDTFTPFNFLKFKKYTFTAGDIQAGGTYTLEAAPGVGKFYQVVQVSAKRDAGTIYDGSQLHFHVGTSTAAAAGNGQFTDISNKLLKSASAHFTNLERYDTEDTINSTINENEDLVVNFSTTSTAGSGDLTVYVSYVILSV